MILNGAVDFPGDVKHQEEQYGPENRVFTLEQNQKRYPKADGEDKERRQKFKEPVLPLPPRSAFFFAHRAKKCSRKVSLHAAPAALHSKAIGLSSHLHRRPCEALLVK